MDYNSIDSDGLQLVDSDELQSVSGSSMNYSQMDYNPIQSITDGGTTA